MVLKWRKVKPKRDWAEAAYTAPCSAGGVWRIEYRGRQERPTGRVAPPLVYVYLPVGREVKTYPSLPVAKRAVQGLEDSIGVNVLVDYWRLPSGRRGGMDGSPKGYITPLGKRILAEAERIVGRKPMYLTANRTGLVLKWIIAGEIVRRRWRDVYSASPSYRETTTSPTVDVAAVSVYRDWLLDLGFDVEMTYPEPRDPEKDSRRYIQLRVSGGPA